MQRQRSMSVHYCPVLHMNQQLQWQLSVYLWVSASFKTKLFCETASSLELDNIKNAAVFVRLRQLLNLTTQTLSRNSARFPDFSDTKQFGATSFQIFQYLPICKIECRADGRVPMRFAMFSFHLSKALRLPRKSDAKSNEVLHLSRKIISANLTI